ncbi:CMRF35-like molecule 7 [Alligator mississippiensis]|uniref:CMRF35-like molecule 7 n=1 Tax=Alligator mississippiensis TaxID=8496 RepID=UPI0028775077|nr:CMRF35-like molecule 7 [Alligator mississippiensis]
MQVLLRLWVLFPGCCAGIDLLSLTDLNAVTGPEMAMGPEGGSVSVMCHYRKGYEEYRKFWCRDDPVSCLGSYIIETTRSEAEVWQDRFSIQDNHTQRTITVTVENLVMADTGTYLCGIRRTLRVDPSHAVKLLVSPASTKPTSAAKEEEANFPNQHPTPAGSKVRSIHFLLLVGLKVPVFLCMVCAVVWVSVRYRASSSDTVPHRRDHDLPRS